MIYIKNETEINFYEKIKSKKVICFGAGSNAHWIVNRYLIPENIVCFVDNFKAGTFIEINGREIDVISFEEIIIKLVNDSYDYIFVITTLKFSDEFILQLDNLGIFDGKIFYLPELLVPPNQEIIFDKNNSNIIPKKIHYCWFGHSEIPMQYKENIESWKKYCPDYEIIEWNENNYDITRNKYMFQAYQNKKWGFVPDYARIDIINTYGGIYLDLDVEIIKSFDYLLQFDMFCGFEDSVKVNFGQGFGAHANHNILKKMLEEYKKINFIDKEGNLNVTPSPVYQTRTLQTFGLIKNGKNQRIENCMVFSSSFFSPQNVYGFGEISTNTFSIHKYAASWYDENQLEEKNRIRNNYKYIKERMIK